MKNTKNKVLNVLKKLYDIHTTALANLFTNKQGYELKADIANSKLQELLMEREKKESNKKEIEFGKKISKYQEEQKKKRDIEQGVETLEVH